MNSGIRPGAPRAVLLLFTVSLLGMSGLVLAGRPGPLDLVETLDLERYQGRWYQIALLPNRFQDQCVGETSAEYTLLDNGRVRVVNRCRTAGGEFEEVVGEARRPDPGQPAKLKVRFAPKWLAWLPLVWGDYQVMALDQGYRSVLVGEPSREFLWVLAREPSIPTERLDALLAEARRQGFDSDRIVMSRQQRP